MPRYEEDLSVMSFLLRASCTPLGCHPRTQLGVFAVSLRNIAVPVDLAIVGKFKSVDPQQFNLYTSRELVCGNGTKTITSVYNLLTKVYTYESTDNLRRYSPIETENTEREAVHTFFSSQLN
jgi:hypothetical protein